MSTDPSGEIHHPVFAHFNPWRGEVDGGWDVNWLGVKTRSSYYSLIEVPAEPSVVQPPLPRLDDEEYFEWIDLLEAVVAAHERFTMVELGAGYGRWLANAAAAVAQYSGLPCVLVGVEAEPQHFTWLRQHLDDNRVGPKGLRLIRAAIASADGEASFHMGRAFDWYGQALAPTNGGRIERTRRRLGATLHGSRLRRVTTLSLDTLLRDMDRVDLVDADIQGAEGEVFEAAHESLRRKVRRVHVETHGPENDARVAATFRELGWEQVYGFPSLSDVDTPYGRIHFEGGVQSWINPTL